MSRGAFLLCQGLFYCKSGIDIIFDLSNSVAKLIALLRFQAEKDLFGVFVLNTEVHKKIRKRDPKTRSSENL